MVTRRRPEQDIQKALADHLRLSAAPGTYWFQPANGGRERQPIAPS